MIHTNSSSESTNSRTPLGKANRQAFNSQLVSRTPPPNRVLVYPSYYSILPFNSIRSVFVIGPCPLSPNTNVNSRDPPHLVWHAVKRRLPSAIHSSAITHSKLFTQQIPIHIPCSLNHVRPPPHQHVPLSIPTAASPLPSPKPHTQKTETYSPPP